MTDDVVTVTDVLYATTKDPRTEICIRRTVDQWVVRIRDIQTWNRNLSHALIECATLAAKERA